MTGDGTDGIDIMGSTIASKFPNATEAFEFTYKDDLNYNDFYEAVFEARNDGPPYPYRYGSYQIYKADTQNHLYQVVSFLNVTSQDVSALYPQYMYTALLRAATGHDDLEFNIITTPFPIYQMFKDKEEAGRALDYAFVTAIALALVPCVMV